MSKQEILAELPRLTAGERAQVAQALQDLAIGEHVVLSSFAEPIPRANMHAGAWEVADDFDAPLPDEFWLGQDA